LRDDGLNILFTNINNNRCILIIVSAEQQKLFLLHYIKSGVLPLFFIGFVVDNNFSSNEQQYPHE
jgi:hypothetical protein